MKLELFCFFQEWFKSREAGWNTWCKERFKRESQEDFLLESLNVFCCRESVKKPLVEFPKKFLKQFLEKFLMKG